MNKGKITQCRKPHGGEGIETIKNMNKNHEEISEYAFECVDLRDVNSVLDIGCGGGVNIEKFLKSCNIVWGLDYSDVSVLESIKQNQEAVDEGKCKIIEANVTDMPIKDESFDLVSAFETVYFWPDLPDTFKEVYRIIKPGGKFLIALGTDGNHPDDEKWLGKVEGMSVYTPQQLSGYLQDAGFSDVDVSVKGETHIMVVIAGK